jgi:hypothetical protein
VTAVRAAQLGEIRAATGLATEVGDEATHVRALAARDRDPHACAFEREQLAAIDAHATRRALDLDARARLYSRTPPCLIAEYIGGMILLADMCGLRRGERFARHAVDRFRTTIAPSRSSVSVRFKRDPRRTASSANGYRDLRRLVGADQQHARRDRIERAAVTGVSRRGRAT